MKLNFNSPKGVIRLYTISVAASAALVTLLRLLSLFLFFDGEIGYYRSGAVLPVVDSVLLAALPLAMLVYAILKLRSSLSTDADEKRGPTLFFAGIGVILFLMISLALAYFDVTVQMNAPDKLIFLVACIAGMLFVTEELRLYFGTVRPVLYFFSLGCALLFLSAASIPTLIAVLFGKMEAPSWVLANLLLLGLLICAALRTRSLLRSLKEDVAPENAPDKE